MFLCHCSVPLRFEEGPSVDITLQWATYRDASDQTSLSRILGGIHPPVDDLPGRLIGEKIGISAFNKAKTYFEGSVLTEVTQQQKLDNFKVYPNPVRARDLTIAFERSFTEENISFTLMDMNGRVVLRKAEQVLNHRVKIGLDRISEGIYILSIDGEKRNKNIRIFIQN